MECKVWNGVTTHMWPNAWQNIRESATEFQWQIALPLTGTCPACRHEWSEISYFRNRTTPIKRWDSSDRLFTAMSSDHWQQSSKCHRGKCATESINCSGFRPFQKIHFLSVMLLSGGKKTTSIRSSNNKKHGALKGTWTTETKMLLKARRFIASCYIWKIFVQLKICSLWAGIGLSPCDLEPCWQFERRSTLSLDKVWTNFPHQNDSFFIIQSCDNSPIINVPLYYLAQY